MRKSIYILGALVFTLALTTASSSQRRGKRGVMNTSEILAAVKPGQWVGLEAVIQPDFSVVCEEVEILTGDFLDDDWGISGIVRGVDQLHKKFRVFQISVKVDKDSEYENDADTFKSFKDLRKGMLVDLEGTYLKDGTFLATEVEEESEKLEKKPNLKREIEFVGRVEKVDVAKRRITLMGISFQLTDATEGKSVIK